MIAVDTASDSAKALLRVTPEAIAGMVPSGDVGILTIDDVRSGYALLSDDVGVIDLVWIGCPHASLPEISRVAEMVKGQHLALPLWITCARPVRDLAVAQGLVDVIEAAGGSVFADACMAIAPVRDLGFSAVATASAKGAYYLRNLAKVDAVFGDLEQCIDAAVAGGWQKPRFTIDGSLAQSVS